MSRQKKKGFTLVELVVVLVIMMVILGIAIPSVLHYMKMAEFRKNEENAKTVYLAAESKLTYYRSSGQWEEFKKEVMSQGKEAPFTDSKRKGKSMESRWIKNMTRHRRQIMQFWVFSTDIPMTKACWMQQQVQVFCVWQK